MSTDNEPLAIVGHVAALAGSPQAIDDEDVEELVRLADTDGNRTLDGREFKDYLVRHVSTSRGTAETALRVVEFGIPVGSGPKVITAQAIWCAAAAVRSTIESYGFSLRPSRHTCQYL